MVSFRDSSVFGFGWHRLLWVADSGVVGVMAMCSKWWWWWWWLSEAWQLGFFDKEETNDEFF